MALSKAPTKHLFRIVNNVVRIDLRDAVFGLLLGENFRYRVYKQLEYLSALGSLSVLTLGSRALGSLRALFTRWRQI